MVAEARKENPREQIKTIGLPSPSEARLLLCLSDCLLIIKRLLPRSQYQMFRSRERLEARYDLDF